MKNQKSKLRGSVVKQGYLLVLAHLEPKKVGGFCVSCTFISNVFRGVESCAHMVVPVTLQFPSLSKHERSTG